MKNKKRLLSLLLSFAMAFQMLLPISAQAITAPIAEEAATDTNPIDSSTFSSLGIAQTASKEDLPGTPYGEGVFAANVLSELHVSYGGAKDSGYYTADNLQMNTTNGKTESTFTALDGTILGGSGGGAMTERYRTEAAFSMGNGKDDMIAALTVLNDVIWLEICGLSKNGRRFLTYATIPLDAAAKAAINGALWEAELTALFELTTGDFDGDGLDEIALSVPGTRAYVQLYQYDPDEGSVVPYGGPCYLTGSSYGGDTQPVVSMAAEDLDGDKDDKLIVSVSQPYSATASDIRNDSKLLVYAYDKNSKGMKSAYSLPLNTNGGTGASAVVARYAGVAAGDLTGDGKPEIVVAGFQGTAVQNSVCSVGKDAKIYYNVVRFDHSAGSYTAANWSNVNVPNIDNLYELYDETNQYLPPIAMATAATAGTGYAETLFMAGGLYSFDGVAFTLAATSADISENNYPGSTNISIAWMEKVIGGNFDGNNRGQEQFVYSLGVKAKGSSTYTYWYDVGFIKNIKFGDLTEYQTGKQTLLMKNKATVTTGSIAKGLYVSVCAVDVDDDSTMMRYVDGSKTISYSNPEVLVVMQSAPYFQDLADTNDGYLDNGSTAFGKSKGSSSSFTAGAEVSAGAMVAFEQDIGVFGIKLASIEAEFQTMYTVSYGHEKTWETSTSVEYAGNVGDDYVVVYSVPYVDYAYEVFVPKRLIPGSGSYESFQAAYSGNSEYRAFIDKYMKDIYNNEESDSENWGKMTDDQRTAARTLVWDAGIKPGATIGGNWEKTVISFPLDATTSILTVDRYDAIAEKTAGLEPIRGNVLHSTPGVPSTYTKAPTGFKTIGGKQSVTAAGGSSITVSREESYSESNTFDFSFNFEGKVAAGAAGVKVGVIAGGGASLGGATADFSGTAYTATVDNLPSDADEYSMGWQFGFYKAKIGKNNALVLGYQTSNVIAPPPIPRNLTVSAVSADSISLEWEPTTTASYYILSNVQYDGTTLPVATLPSTQTNYTNEKLRSSTAYAYCISAISSGGLSSRDSAPITGTTLAADAGAFQITKQPTDATTFAGGAATFSTAASYWDIEGNASSVKYQWQSKSPGGSYTSITGATGPSYTASKVTTAMNGRVYRCTAFVDSSSFIYSDEVTLTIGKADSVAAVTAPAEGKIVKPTYLKAQDGGSVSGDFYTNARITQNGVEFILQLLRNGDNTALVAAEANGKQSETTYTGGIIGTNNVVDVSKVTVIGTNVVFEFSTGSTYYCDALEAMGKFTPFTMTGGGAPSEPSDIINKFTFDGVEYSYDTMFDKKYEDESNDWIMYRCKDTATEMLSEYFILYSDEYYSTYSSQQAVTTINDVQYDSDSMVLAQMKYTPTAEDGYQVVTGDSVTLTAGLASQIPGQAIAPAGEVSFRIVAQNGGSSAQLAARQNGSAYEATWVPGAPGAYLVYADYAGNSYYNGSSSQGVTVYAVIPGEATLALSGENMVYGKSQDLIATVNTTDGSTPIAPTGFALFQNGKEVKNLTDILTIGDKKLVFTPPGEGDYTVTVTYTHSNKEYTASKNIRVYKDTLRVTAQNAASQVNAELSTLGYELSKTLGDTAAYFEFPSQEQIDKSKAGDYPIEVALTDDGAAALGAKYTVQLVPGTYTVTPITHKVTATTPSANGKVDILYSNAALSVPIDSGSKVIAGGTITVTAYPNRGFKVGGWTVNDKPLDNTNTSQTFTVTEDFEIEVTFDPVMYTLTATPGENGAVAGSYLANGVVGGKFTSGGKLSPTQTVRLTATPEPDYVVKSWTVNGAEIKAADGKSPYTAATYDVKNIDKDTTVTVAFESAQSMPVTVKVQDRQGSIISGAVVTINGEKTAAYAGTKGEQVVVQVDAPGGYILDTWTPAGLGLVSGDDKSTLTISGLKSSADIVVTYTVLGGYTLKTETGPNGSVALKQNETTVSAGAAAAAQAGDALVYTATPDEGYVLDKWTLNASTDLKDGIAEGNTLSLTVSDAIAQNAVITVKATFKAVAAPVTYSVDGTGGTLEATVASGTTLTVDTKILFTAKPGNGYRVGGWYVDDTLQENESGSTFVYSAKAYTAVNIQVKFEVIPTYAITFTDPDASQGSLEAAYNSAEFTSGTIAEESGTIVFTATPATDYHVESWTVDGEVVDGATATMYTLTVSGAHTVSVAFASGLAVSLTPGAGYTYTDEAGEPISGSITVETNAAVSFKVVLDAAYSSSEISVNVGEETLNATEGLYTIENITENKTVTVTGVTKNTYTITTAATGEGTVTASASQVEHGGTATVTITPKSGHEIVSVIVDGADKGKITTHTFTDVTQNHVVTATFAAIILPETLVSITAPEAITKIANGTALADIDLPETVGIVTDTEVNTEASVAWNRASAAPTYDPASKAEQTFTLTGTVTLPEVVLNPEEIALTVAVSVTVMADTRGSELASITPPTAIKGLENGTALADIVSRLPGRIGIVTRANTARQADVAWELNSATPAYDPASKTAQTFVLSGTVILPQGISNPDMVSLAVEISITVAAAPSSGGGGGGSSAVKPPVTPDSPDLPTIAETDVSSKTDKDGNATAAVAEKDITNAIDKAQKEAKKNGTEANDIALVLNVAMDENATSLGVIVPSAAVKALIDAGVAEQSIKNDLCSVTLDLATLKSLAGGEMELSINTVDPQTLSAKAQAAIASRPVFQFGLTVGGKAVTDFKDGSVGLQMPYTLTGDETADNLMGVFVDSDGSVTWLENSSFDPITGTLFTSTPHFSVFGVGYKRDTPKFTDITGHWGEKHIDFVAARGLLTGTGATVFSPDTSMTRGMFVTVLGRLAGVDTKKYTASKFGDVKTDAYYAPYVAWANTNHIANGTSDTTFSPDMAISRQEMAVMLANYSKAMGYKLPSVHTEVVFADSASIGAWAKDAVKQTQMAGILMGKSGNRFDPTATASRAEVSAMLHRYVELVESTETAEG